MTCFPFCQYEFLTGNRKSRSILNLVLSRSQHLPNQAKQPFAAEWFLDQFRAGAQRFTNGGFALRIARHERDADSRP